MKRTCIEVAVAVPLAGRVVDINDARILLGVSGEELPFVIERTASDEDPSIRSLSVGDVATVRCELSHAPEGAGRLVLRRPVVGEVVRVGDVRNAARSLEGVER